jgi:hypothetical protein
MARLKVKQISDIQTYVQGLIDNDSDQNATLISNNASSISAVSTALVNEATSTGNEIDALEASVDSLELIAGGSVTADLAASVDSLEDIDAGLASDIATNEGNISTNAGNIVKVSQALSVNDADNVALTASVDSLELLAGGSIIANLAASVSDNDTRVDAILELADGELDSFVEVIAYVNSVDAVGDLDLTNALATVNASIDSLEDVDTALSTALNNEINTTNGEIKVLQDAVSSLDTFENEAIASIDSLELLAGGSTIADLQSDLDAVSDALSTEISTTNDEVSDLQDSVDALEAADVMLHQEGTVTAIDTFSLVAPVRFGISDDIHVHVNGHTIKPASLVDGEAAPNDHGWISADGRTFNFVGIGYDIDAEDVVYVQAIKA